MSEHDALKEFWANPERDRRNKNPGRREGDYEVCPFHAGHCAQDEKDKTVICAKISELGKELKGEVKTIHSRIDKTDSRMVGRWAFGVVITILLAMIAGFGTLNYQINSSMMREIVKLEKAVSENK